MRDRCNRLATLAALLILLVIGGVPGVFGGVAHAKELFETSDDLVADTTPHSRFAELARDAAAGVVNVRTSRTVTQPELPDAFREFFGGPGRGPQQGPQEREVPSLGTGWVISKDGFIVTNNHVIDGVDKIEVGFVDGETLPAEIVGQDPKTDLALIRVIGDKELTPLPLGDSDAILPGDWVVAIGNPFGLGHTVTVGIVSAKGRQIGAGPYDDFIQTDAAINPGNSGGPLLDIRGRVVGINTAINPRANTIGFAVPVNLAKEILPQLQDGGTVVRGWLGVAIQEVSPEFEEAFDLPSRAGALISEVIQGSPAEDAGFAHGDVIVRFDGETVKDVGDLPRIVSRTPIGKKVKVAVYRDGKEKTLKAKIAELKDAETVVPEKADAKGPGGFGFRVRELTPQDQQMGVELDSGLLVSAVLGGSAAEKAGVQRGDIIIEVNKDAVKTMDELREALGDQDRVLLRIARKDRKLYAMLTRKPPKE
jgi:serine protease Do